MFVNAYLRVDTVDTFKSFFFRLALTFVGKSMNMTERRPEKLSRIDEDNMLNLGLRKTKQETTAPQIISFHRTLQREKHKHRTRKGLRSPQHRELKFYSLHHRSKKTIESLSRDVFEPRTLTGSFCSCF